MQGMMKTITQEQVSTRKMHTYHSELVWRHRNLKTREGWLSSNCMSKTSTNQFNTAN